MLVAASSVHPTICVSTCRLCKLRFDMMGVSIAVSKSWVCLNLIEVGTIKKYQPHPETVCSTSLTFTKALAAEGTLFFNHVLDCLPLAVARVTRMAQAWKWPCAWLPCPCTHDTWCGCQTWSRISAICRSSWSWVASSPWSPPWTRTSWAASSRTWQLTGFSGKDSHPRMSELAQT